MPEHVGPGPDGIAVRVFGDTGLAFDDTEQVESAISGYIQTGDTFTCPQIHRCSCLEGPARRIGVANPASVEEHVQHAVAIDIDER